MEFLKVLAYLLMALLVMLIVCTLGFILLDAAKDGDDLEDYHIWALGFLIAIWLIVAFMFYEGGWPW